MLPLTTLHRHLRWIALAAIVISIATWTLDLTGLVYTCPYCRVQRSVIGLLGLLLLWPDPRGWRFTGSTGYGRAVPTSCPAAGGST